MLAIRQVLGAHKYSVSYCIVSYQVYFSVGNELCTKQS